MKKISNETLAEEATASAREGFSVGMAVKSAFNKHNLFNPRRFGQVCRLVEYEMQTTSVTQGKTPRLPWYQTGSMA